MKLEVTVPESLSEITLKNYQKFLESSKDSNDDLFIKQKMVQYFCNIPLEAVMKIKKKDFNAIIFQLSEVLKEQPDHTPIFELGGTKFGFIPDLDSDLTFGEFVDVDLSISNWADYHKMMAVLYRPIVAERKGKYQIEEYSADDTYHQLMKSAPMHVVLGAVLFFYRLGNELLTITPKYLQALLRKNHKAMEALEQNGVGISTYTNSLEVACSELRTLLPYTLGRPFTS